MKLDDLRIWRVVAIALGASLMLGESARSWGQGRNPLFFLDDFFIGVPLVVSGVLMARPTVARLCALCASFAAAAGLLYSSFFAKVAEPSAPMESNIGPGVLTALIGGAFVVALLGAFATLHSATRRSESSLDA